MKHFALLTSSRADWGIYLPLIKEIRSHKDIQIDVIAFGSHLESAFGHTIDEVRLDCKKVLTMDVPYEGDKPEEVTRHFAQITLRFSKLWNKEKDDLDGIIALGDRYEMLAAVLASAMFNIPIFHLHGGETSDGALDDAFRHSLSHLASHHLVSHPSHADRVKQLKGGEQNIHVVGSLSLDGIDSFVPMSISEFQSEFQVDLSKPTILFTYHPVTRGVHDHEHEAYILSRLIRASTDYQFLVTLPNMDPGNSILRKNMIDLGKECNHVQVRESLGKKGYFSALHHCLLIMGNSSSALIESASFRIHAIDIGSRQSGRVRNPNVVHCKLEEKALLSCLLDIIAKGDYEGENEFYNDEGAAKATVSILAS